jgi:hypothetical protein
LFGSRRDAIVIVLESEVAKSESITVPRPGEWIQATDPGTLWVLSERLGKIATEVNALRDAIDLCLLESGYEPPGEPD